MLFESGRDDVLNMFFYRGVNTGLEFLLVYRGLQCVRGVPARMSHWTVDPGAPVSEHSAMRSFPLPPTLAELPAHCKRRLELS